MPRDGKQRATVDATPTLSLGQTVCRLAKEIAILKPGPAAALRRGPRTGAGAAAFWQLLAAHGPDHELGEESEDGWSTLIQAIAILTPKGRSTGAKTSAHDPTIAMGVALHDAGVSELRLARLLTAPPEMRRTLTVRLCRWLAAAEQRRFDLKTLAHFVLRRGDTGHRIARDYYRAQATAGRQQEPEENRSDA